MSASPEVDMNELNFNELVYNLLRDKKFVALDILNEYGDEFLDSMKALTKGDKKSDSVRASYILLEGYMYRPFNLESGEFFYGYFTKKFYNETFDVGKSTLSPSSLNRFKSSLKPDSKRLIETFRKKLKGHELRKKYPELPLYIDSLSLSAISEYTKIPCEVVKECMPEEILKRISIKRINRGDKISNIANEWGISKEKVEVYTEDIWKELSIKRLYDGGSISSIASELEISKENVKRYIKVDLKKVSIIRFWHKNSALKIARDLEISRDNVKEYTKYNLRKRILGDKRIEGLALDFAIPKNELIYIFHQRILD